MSFPHDDAAWAETAAFLRGRLAPADRVLAPDPFRWAIPRAERFDGIGTPDPAGFAFVVVHKGELEQVPRHLLDALLAPGPARPVFARPVFANPVFVVFAAASGLPDLTETDHVRALLANHRSLPAAQPVIPEPAEASPPPGTPPAAPLPPEAPPLGRPVARPAPPPRPVRPPPRAEAPPRPWLLPGGAAPGTARENAFQAELDRLVAEYLGPAEGEAVLDIGCGAGRLGGLLPNAERVTGIDLSPAALAAAQARHAGLATFAFARMDAARLAFADASFDTVLLLDTAETLADLPAVLAEAARVLARGGRLLVSAMNRDSLVLRAQRRLGAPVPQAGFTVSELTGLLRAAGLSVTRSDGCFLSPGWGLPGAAPGLAALEEDPEFIESSRQLGRRAGPDHALAFVLLAQRR